MKRCTVIALIIVLTVLTAGCGIFSKNDDQAKDIIPPEPDGERVKLTLYFANDEYIQTGNADLDMLLTEDREITLKDQTLAEAAMQELAKGPELEGMSGVIPSRVNLKGVEVEDGISYVNFSGEGLWGGSLEEGILVSSVLMTLTELEDIEGVQFLVDGEKAESLMGHIATMDPLTRDER